MTQQFSHLGMMVERVPATDGGLPEVAAAAALAQLTELGLRISVGAYACFQSHREVWRKIAASGETHGLVMEDDLVPVEGFSTTCKTGGCRWVPMWCGSKPFRRGPILMFFPRCARVRVTCSA